jgi:hypothetical protein
MKTATVVRFDSLDAIHAACRQTNAQEILNGHVCLTDEGWTDIEVSPEVRAQVIDEVVKAAGGRMETRRRMHQCLTNERPQHWALRRMIVEKYNGAAFVHYCAGQDYTFEMKQLRAKLSA